MIPTLYTPNRRDIQRGMQFIIEPLIKNILKLTFWDETQGAGQDRKDLFLLSDIGKTPFIDNLEARGRQ